MNPRVTRVLHAGHFGKQGGVENPQAMKEKASQNPFTTKTHLWFGQGRHQSGIVFVAVKTTE